MSGRLVQRIWVPDTYIVNSQTSFIHDVTTRNGLIRLYPNGTVLYVLRITSKVNTRFDCFDLRTSNAAS